MRDWESKRQPLGILLATLLLLLNTLLHAHVYGNRNFREDEISTVHTATTLTPQQITQWLATDVHPPGWMLLADIWIEILGISEAIARWSSKLLNLISFALVFQLGKHLLDRRVALYAVALLGLYGFASNSMYELRPYSMLITLASALHLVFWRWQRKPTGKLMVAYAALGIAVIYTHFYAFTVFAAHALFLAAWRRYDRRLIVHTISMWLFVALSFSPWILPLLQTVLGSFAGGYYAVDFATLLEQISFSPAIVFEFLLIASLVALYTIRGQSLRRSMLRWLPQSRLAYPLFLLLATFAVALIVNSAWSVLNARGFTVVVMLVALALALGLRLLPAKASIAFLFVLYLNAPANIAFQPSNGPYREIIQAMAPSYQEESVVVTDFSWAWRWLLAATYYLTDFTPDKMSKDRIFHLVEPRDTAHPPTYPDEIVNIFRSFEPEIFGYRLPAHKQLWHLSQGGGNDLGRAFEDWLHQNYALLQTQTWDEPYVTTYMLSEYARAPEHRGPLLLAGDALQLYAWQLRDSVEVEACQSVTVENWWQVDAQVELSYSLSIILADLDGDSQLGIQNSIPADVFTTNWQPDRFYRDRTSLKIPCAIADGRYNLLLAAKETVSGAILPLRYPDGNAVGNEFYLTTLHVTAG